MRSQATSSIYELAKNNASEMKFKITIISITLFSIINSCFNTNQQLLFRASKVILQIATEQLQALPFIKILQCKDDESY